ncbi:hypothetical protein DYE20_23530 [[Mycobacterium] chelonae subsp. gwanakae]|nr:hypothetical protein DYE20_23530 [[Mycobacterium] chelonae subsp. gwanakae]
MRCIGGSGTGSGSTTRTGSGFPHGSSSNGSGNSGSWESKFPAARSEVSEAELIPDCPPASGPSAGGNSSSRSLTVVIFGVVKGVVGVHSSSRFGNLSS